MPHFTTEGVLDTVHTYRISLQNLLSVLWKIDPRADKYAHEAIVQLLNTENVLVENIKQGSTHGTV